MNDSINIQGLAEDDIRLIRDFVDFLKNKRRLPTSGSEDKEWIGLSEQSFLSDWDNDADAGYDNWKEYYNVSEG